MLGAGFPRRLALVAGGGAAARVAYGLAVLRDEPLGIDAMWYQLQGSFIADGLGYLDPAAFFQAGRAVPTASFPPLFPTFLGAVQWLGVSSITGLRLAGLVPAVVTIVLTGLLARRLLGDDRVALLAAAIVAVSPLVIATDGSLMSETLTVPITLVVLLLLHRLRREPRPSNVILIGVVAGLGALARVDVALVALVGAAIVLAVAGVRTTRAVAAAAAVALVMGLVVAPWVVRNERQLGTATVATASVATALAGANCDPSYGGADLGAWTFECLDEDRRTIDNEVAWSDDIRDRAIDHARTHLGDLPVVAGARVLRLWGVWDPRDALPREAEESRRLGWQQLAWAAEIPVLILAGVGAWTLRRRRRELAELSVPLITVTLTGLATYGNARFRAPAEPVLAILAAAAVVRLATRSYAPSSVPRIETNETSSPG
jgi:4-amino-4-deoxy-L-arabinose transferase-like glycosyltransferase